MDNITNPIDHLPPLLTVPEAARLCRISRSAAYQQASEYLSSDGARGLPTVRFGRTLRVPSRLLLEHVLGGDGR